MKWLRLIPMLLFSIPAFAAGGSCPTGANYGVAFNQTLASLGVTNCYYASKALGSDSNTGVDEAHSFAHIPGMYGCSSTCAGITPGVGTGVIMRGGDTWTNSELGIYWAPTWSGTSSHPMYIGVDQTWFAGASFARPIFDMQTTSFQGAYPGNCAVICIWGNYTTVDDIEVKNTYTTNGSGSLAHCTGCQNSNFQRLYFHAWGHHTSGSGDFDGANGFSADSSSTGTCIHDSIFDGADTTKDMLAVMFSFVPCAYNNYIAYATNGFEASGDNWHDNWVNYTPQDDTWQGILGHLNAIFLFAPAFGGNSQFVYNNVVSNAWVGSSGGGSGGGVWLNGNIGSSIGSNTLYAFNNVSWGNNPGWSGLGPCSHAAVNCGTYEIFNNTTTCGRDSGTTDTCNSGAAISCGAGGQAGQTGICHIGNNHLIGTTATDYSCNFMTCSTPSPYTSDITQTYTTANSQGYNDANGFSPSNGAGSTINAGGNSTSICTAISNIGGTASAAAAAACQKGTGYACSYTTGTLTCPAKTEVSRSSVSAWDSGAYEFGSAGPSFSYSPNPVAFGNVNTGSTSPITVTISNPGTASLVIGTLSSNNGKFTLSSDVCSGHTVTANGSCTFILTFAPTVAGALSATITVPDNFGNPDTISATGTGVTSGPVVSLNPTTLAFGSQIINVTSAGQTTTLTNTGNATLTITSIVSGDSQYVISQNTCGATLVAGLNCAVTVTFKPSSSGEHDSTLTFATNAATSPDVVTLTGAGAHVAYVTGQAADTTSASNIFNFTYTPAAAGNAIVVGALCHASSGSPGTITLTAPGWNKITQIVSPTATGLGGVGALFGAIALNTAQTTFTVTFGSVANCSTFSGYILGEFSGNNIFGAGSTFNATSSSGGTSGGCGQTAANITPPQDNEALYAVCFDNATQSTAPWLQGANDLNGNIGIFDVLGTGTAGVPVTPAYLSSTGFYVVMGTAIAPPSVAPGCSMGTNIGIGAVIGCR